MIRIVVVCQTLIFWQLFSVLHKNWFSVSVTADLLLKPTVNEHKIYLNITIALDLGSLYTLSEAVWSPFGIWWDY